MHLEIRTTYSDFDAGLLVALFICGRELLLKRVTVSLFVKNTVFGNS